MALLSAPARPCVSIYLPTRPLGAGDEPARIRLKNLLVQAAERLGSARADLLAPAQALVSPGDLEFWRHQEEGLGLFLAPGVFLRVPIPFAVDERVEMGDRFVIRPLLPLLGGGPFHVLALSRNEVRLLEARGREVRRVDLAGVPKSLVEALGEQVTTRILQYHTASPAGPGARTAVYHGRGGGDEDDKAELLRYFRRVDAGLGEVLRDRSLPLVLAGVDYLLNLFRSASRHPWVAAEGIAGNPEHLGDAELARRARPLVEPFFTEDRHRTAARFEALAGSGRTSYHITEILPAAREGKVAALFLSTGADLRGSFGEDGRVHPGGEDLLDLAATWTLDRGGTVYAVPRTEVPEEADVAALFRY